MATAYLGIGSNLGDRRTVLRQACDRLERVPGVSAVRLGPIYETAPVGGPADQGAFLNAAVAVDTELPAAELVAACQRIEQAMGRPDETQRVRWGPRVLDLDLLLYDEAIIDADGLTVPHPRMHERWFVLKPLADLAPQARHPTLDRTIAELLEIVEAQQSACDEPTK